MIEPSGLSFGHRATAVGKGKLLAKTEVRRATRLATWQGRAERLTALPLGRLRSSRSSTLTRWRPATPSCMPRACASRSLALTAARPFSPLTSRLHTRRLPLAVSTSATPTRRTRSLSSSSRGSAQSPRAGTRSSRPTSPPRPTSRQSRACASLPLPLSLPAADRLVERDARLTPLVAWASCSLAGRTRWRTREDGASTRPFLDLRMHMRPHCMRLLPEPGVEAALSWGGLREMRPTQKQRGRSMRRPCKRRRALPGADSSRRLSHEPARTKATTLIHPWRPPAAHTRLPALQSTAGAPAPPSARLGAPCTSPPAGQ